MTVQTVPPATANDDHGGDAASASSLSLAVAMSGRIDFAADLDWFAVELDSGKDYQFRTLSPGAGMDTILRLIAPDGTTELDKNDNGAPGDPNSLVRYTAAAAGTHYLEVAHADSITSGPVLPCETSFPTMHTVGLTSSDQLVIGGEFASSPSDSCYVWNTSTGTISASVRMFSPRVYHTSVNLQDGRILVISGAFNPNYDVIPGCEIFSR